MTGKRKPHVRITRKGEKLVASTLYIPEKIDGAYAAHAVTLTGTSKSKLMVKTLEDHVPQTIPITQTKG